MSQMEIKSAPEMEEHSKAEALAEEIQQGLLKSFTDSLPDENSDNDIKNVLLDDDHLLEELMDRVAVLNMMEAASGGRLTSAAKKKDSKDTKGEVSEEELEEAYLSVMDSLFELSKLMTPLSGVGRDRLYAGVSMIREFEKLYWPLSTRVTEENIASFRELLTEEQYVDVLHGATRAIGALRHVGREVYAAGVICYSIPGIQEDTAPMITLEYIRVHEDLREKGIGNFLMGELLGLALQNEGTLVRVSLPVQIFDGSGEEEGKAALYNFFDDWGFGFSLVTEPRFVIRLGDLQENRMMAQPPEAGESFADLGKEGAGLFAAFLEELGESCDPLLKKRPFSFFDPDISCVIRKDGKIKSVLLFRSFADGTIRYEGFYGLGEREPVEVVELSRFAARKCMDSGETDRMLYGTLADEKALKTAVMLMPKARCPMMYEGILEGDENALTTEEWDRLREKAGLSGDMIPDTGLRDKGIGKGREA